MRRHRASCSTMLLALIVSASAYAHVSVRPREAAPGATQQYTLRVPNEKSIATVRVEAEFPANVEILSVEPKDGWKVELKKNDSGRIVAAAWSGFSLAPHEIGELHISAKNPPDEGTLVWKVVQVYEDGTRSEWTGEQGSRAPAPVVQIKKQ